jgi:nucleoside-diphosphate-sugar epimerase
MRRVLISGANGFIGDHLCTRLVNEGVDVHALSRGSQPQDRNGVRWWNVDLADFEAARACVRAIRPDIFFHLAGHVSGSRDLSAVLPTFRDNLSSTVHVLISLAEMGCERCVLAGSLEEPAIAGGKIITGSPYAASKFSSSVYGRMFFDLFQLPVVTMRLFMVYGPRQRDLTKLVPYTITSMLRNDAPRFTSGVRPIDWIYVDDVIDGMLAAAFDQREAGYMADLGSGELVSVRDVVLEIARQMNVTDAIDFGSIPERPLERVRKADVAHTKARLGWTPRLPLTEGLGRTIEYYRALVDRRGA